MGTIWVLIILISLGIIYLGKQLLDNGHGNAGYILIIVGIFELLGICISLL